MDPARFLTSSLRAFPWGVRVARILAAALDAVDPGAAVRLRVHLQGGKLIVDGHPYPLEQFDRVLLVGAGKAGFPMAESLVALLGDRITRGLVIVKDGYLGHHNRVGKVDFLIAGHPLPDRRGLEGTRRVIELLSGTGKDDLVICLISGGGSALLTQPVDGVSLEDLQGLTGQLLVCGAEIAEINTLRKHLDRVKGGGLARLAFPATVVTLILSDVIGNAPDMVASGPTTPDPTTFLDAWMILEKFDLLGKVAPSIRRWIESGCRREKTAPSEDGDPQFQRVRNVVIGDNRLAMEAAVAQARREGFHARLMPAPLQGEAREMGFRLGVSARKLALEADPLPRPACLVWGGETAVTIRGPGAGGRNQELALAAVGGLAGLPSTALVALATDGGDGPTDAAGAVVTGKTAGKARQAGLDWEAFLARNDSYAFFNALDDLLRPGPTLTNVNDLVIVFSFKGA